MNEPCVIPAFDLDTPVGAIAARMPSSTRVFQRFRIDYCCGGKIPLREACVRARIPADTILEALEELREEPSQQDWTAIPLSELADYIVRTHHVYTREETEALVALATKVERVHGENHPAVIEVAGIVRTIEAELREHMLKEEHVLFPFAAQAEIEKREGRTPPRPPFGTVKNPIRMMMFEHDQAAELLRRLREVTGDYELPEGACMSFQALYFRLQELEADLHQHIHLENNVYFPRAIELE